MKVKVIVGLVLLAFVVASCRSTSPCDRRGDNIPHTQANGYFVKNTVKRGNLLMRFISQAKFEEYFGFAAVMGEGGRPTSINFDEQYTIAIILDQTEYDTDISSYCLQQEGDNIVLNYKIREGVKQSFTRRPFLLLVLDNKFRGKGNIQFRQIP